MTTFNDATLPPNLAGILEDLRVATVATIDGRRRRSHRRRMLVLAAAALLVLGVSAAASGLLRSPAPLSVKQRIAQVDDGMPAELRLHPEVADARLAAMDGSAHLYVADLPGGGHCLVIVTDGRDHGVPCTSSDAIGKQPIDVSLPSDAAAGPAAPVVIGGRVNERAGIRLALRFDDGVVVDLPLADGGYFIYDVPADRRAAAHGHALALTAFNAAGRSVATVEIPSDWDSDVLTGSGPIGEVLTRSDGNDYTLVLGIDGVVNPAQVQRLELTWPDGGTQDIPFGPDGTFGVGFAEERVDDLATKPATLTAFGPDGAAVASQAVMSVAASRAKLGG
jgi:hypothetical protein